MNPNQSISRTGTPIQSLLNPTTLSESLWQRAYTGLKRKEPDVRLDFERPHLPLVMELVLLYHKMRSLLQKLMDLIASNLRQMHHCQRQY